MKQTVKKKDSVPEPRINNEITGNYDVRVIYTDDDGKQKNEVMELGRARILANAVNMDIIEINANTVPPIVRIDSYEKWFYNEKKRIKEKTFRNKTELKEIQISVNIGHNDIEVKSRKVKEFVNSGDKVKVVLTLKGREVTRREESKKSLYELIEMVSDVAVPESDPKDEGNRTIVILKRKK